MKQTDVWIYNICKIVFGRRQAKTVFEHAQKCAVSDRPAYAQSIIQTFALNSYIL